MKGQNTRDIPPIKAVILELNRKAKETTRGVSKQGVKVQTNGPNGKAAVKRAGGKAKGIYPQSKRLSLSSIEKKKNDAGGRETEGEG